MGRGEQGQRVISDGRWITAVLNAGASVIDKEAPANHHLRHKGNQYSGHNDYYRARSFAYIVQGYLRNSGSGVACCPL